MFLPGLKTLQPESQNQASFFVLQLTKGNTLTIKAVRCLYSHAGVGSGEHMPWVLVWA
jgi:hypothetical protein